ncbi:PadR family transcriptional regulator [Engelhardtia mirabilis]|uniref:Lineage-specific thermal regulator protein n=1 Tax=Engelhardtia mirabilis TaxID=2528011 RepID=A0A518BM39_9BACT|nr:lineage-specific thermal regulator protein [Planctomycetes bacterium Pla133]QDV02375.1 lineage-specific thermal regulator protein [Planctomycetes bacterium Pla86]
MNLKGTLPLLILKVLQGGPLHGYAIAQRIRLLSDGLLDFKEGSLYPTLHGQENRGLIESVEEQERGRARRSYRLTPKGRKALTTEAQQWQSLAAAVDTILEGGPA